MNDYTVDISEDEAKVIIGLCQYHDDACGFMQKEQKQLYDRLRYEFSDLSHYEYSDE